MAMTDIPRHREAEGCGDLEIASSQAPRNDGGGWDCFADAGNDGGGEWQ